MKPTLKQLRDKLKKITHKIVRHGVTHCFTCGKQTQVVAGHFWTDGGHSATRYDFDNLRGQCLSCNSFKSGNLAEYAVRLKDEIGEERFEELRRKAHTIKRWSRAELEQLIEERTQQYNNLTE